MSRPRTSGRSRPPGCTRRPPAVWTGHGRRDGRALSPGAAGSAPLAGSAGGLLPFFTETFRKIYRVRIVSVIIARGVTEPLSTASGPGAMPVLRAGKDTPLPLRSEAAERISCTTHIRLEAPWRPGAGGSPAAGALPVRRRRAGHDRSCEYGRARHGRGRDRERHRRGSQTAREREHDDRAEHDHDARRALSRPLPGQPSRAGRVSRPKTSTPAARAWPTTTPSPRTSAAHTVRPRASTSRRRVHHGRRLDPERRVARPTR